MILLDKPFVSDFLIQSILENDFPVIATGMAKHIAGDRALNWVDEKEAKRLLGENPDIPLYTNSENALSWLDTHLDHSSFAEHARLFKNKLLFREMIREADPGFFFRSITLEQIKYLDPEEIPLPAVIKPSVGFFSIGVHIIRSKSDWEMVKKKLDADILASVYPENVLDTSIFIIEEYIDGEEFAVDAYFNKLGELVILNILHHRFASEEDTSDRVYTSSKSIQMKYGELFRNFLQKLGQKSGIRNFPIHAEMRVDDADRIRLIEVNPMRFGGLCTTADLMGIAMDFNPYQAYHENLQPEWSEIYHQKEDTLFSIIVLNNSTGYDPAKIQCFNYDLLGKDFSNPLLVRKMDVNDFGVFGFVFAETSTAQEEELDQILVSDLRKYIHLK